MGPLTPAFEGALEAAAPPDALERVARRVQRGDFPAVGGSRQRYGVTPVADDEARGYREARATRRMRIVATDWPTRLAIGLNEIDLSLDARGRLSYRVSFREWARFPRWMAIGFTSITLAVAAVLALVGPPISSGAWVGVASGLFWGGLWPWLLAGILVSAHKKIAQRALEQSLAQAIAEEPRARVASAAEERAARAAEPRAEPVAEALDDEPPEDAKQRR